MLNIPNLALGFSLVFQNLKSNFEIKIGPLDSSDIEKTLAQSYIPQIIMESVVLHEEKKTKNSDHKVNNKTKNYQNVKDDDVKNKNNICLFPVFLGGFFYSRL